MAQARKPKFAVGQVVVSYQDDVFLCRIQEYRNGMYWVEPGDATRMGSKVNWFEESELREQTPREKEGIGRARQPKRRRKC